MTKRRILQLAMIGVVPIVIALAITGYDIATTLGNYIVAKGEVVAGSSPAGGSGSNPLRLAVSIGEADAASLRPGQRAEVRVEALSATYSGTVGEVGQGASTAGAALPSAAAGSGVPVLIDFEFGAAPVEAGMSASVRIHRRE